MADFLMVIGIVSPGPIVEQLSRGRFF